MGDRRSGLEAAGLNQARRYLRLQVCDLKVEVDGHDAELKFSLAAGGYATAVLRELFVCDDAARIGLGSESTCIGT